MKICFISDTHTQLHKIKIPECDVLVHCGDALSQGTYSEWFGFIKDFKKIDVETKIYVPGNHDRITELNEDLIREDCEESGIIYLRDSGIIIEGCRFWGSPVTPRFGHNWAWNRDVVDGRTQSEKDNYVPAGNLIENHWKKIPDSTDILITHGPPKGILDVSVYNGVNCGCPVLLDYVKNIKPKIHAFGHIHNWHGTLKQDDILFINASNCTEQYKPTNEPIVVEFKNGEVHE